MEIPGVLVLLEQLRLLGLPSYRDVGTNQVSGFVDIFIKAYSNIQKMLLQQ